MTDRLFDLDLGPLRDTLGVVRRLLKLPLAALVWLVIAVAVFTAGLATGPRELAVAPILLVALYLGWTWRRVHRRKPRARTLYDRPSDWPYANGI